MNLTERIARALYAYENRGGRFDHASPDVLSPYYDLAEIAVAEFRAVYAAPTTAEITEGIQ